MPLCLPVGSRATSRRETLRGNSFHKQRRGQPLMERPFSSSPPRPRKASLAPRHRLLCSPERTWIKLDLAIWVCVCRRMYNACCGCVSVHCRIVEYHVLQSSLRPSLCLESLGKINSLSNCQMLWFMNRGQEGDRQVWDDRSFQKLKLCRLSQACCVCMGCSLGTRTRMWA